MNREPPQQLVRFVAGQLVEHPEDVRTRSQSLEGGVKVMLSVRDTDRGKVIGKGGRTARALRSLVQAAGAVRDERFQLEIVD